MVPESHSLNQQSTPLKFIQLSAMPVDENLSVKKKLKVKLSRVRSADESIESEHERPSQMFSSVVERVIPRNSQNIPISGSYDFNQQSSINGVSTTTFGQETRTAITTGLNKNVKNHSSNEKEIFLAEKAKNGSFVRCAGKRGPETRLCGQKVKKQKIDSRVMQQCRALLKKLMNHQYGFVFNQPVDPVALQIPDYFDVISEPMDLGTIKYKLENKVYSSTSEFAADVRLTFSNAMTYNPPTNWVHDVACEFNRIFNLGWRSLEAKWSGEKSDVDQDPISKGRPSQAANVREHCPKTVASLTDILPMFSMTYAQKQKLKKDLMEISKRKMPQQLLGSFRKLGLIGQKEDKIDLNFDNFDGETAWELQKVIRSYLKSSAAKSADTNGTYGRDSLQKDLHKGSCNSNKPTCGSINPKSCVNPAACPNGSLGDTKSHNSRDNDFTQASSDIDSERSSGGENNRICQGEMLNMDATTKSNANGQMTMSYSAGAVISVDEANIKPMSSPTTSAFFAASGEECQNNTYDEQLSPSKALRAAMLRSRFVDTILKAQQKTLLSNGERVDTLKMQQERERLEKKQREEKARIEAQIKAAETASRMKEETQLKLQREREREAARIALQKMEKSVEIYENIGILKDLEMIESGYATDNGSTMDGVDVMMGAFHGKVLERFGLFMRDECLEDDDELMTGNRNADVEEGEIAS